MKGSQDNVWIYKIYDKNYANYINQLMIFHKQNKNYEFGKKSLRMTCLETNYI